MGLVEFLVDIRMMIVNYLWDRDRHEAVAVSSMSDRDLTSYLIEYVEQAIEQRANGVLSPMWEHRGRSPLEDMCVIHPNSAGELISLRDWLLRYRDSLRQLEARQRDLAAGRV